MEKIEIRLCVNGSVAIVKGKLEALKWQTACGGEAWAKTWHWWTKAMVKSKLCWDWWTNKVTWWYEVDHIHSRKIKLKCWLMMMIKKAWWKLVLVWHQHLRRWNRMRKANVWLVGHFISPVKGWVEKCMTGFRIYGRTIKRGKLFAYRPSSATWAS